MSVERPARWLAIAGIVGPVVFTAGWVVAEALQDEHYSPARHDISDLAALTAQYPSVALATQGVAGLLVIVFALGALRPALTGPDGREPIGAWLVAASLMGLDTLSDAFFRLDCQAADSSCTASVAVASWHGKVHLLAALVAVVATIAASFALARAMRRTPGWDDLAGPSRTFGWFLVLGVVATAATEGSSVQGLVQRTLALAVSAAVVVLAVRVRRLDADLSAGAPPFRGYGRRKVRAGPG
jgi:Protein of unknown function (DUF998)